MKITFLNLLLLGLATYRLALAVSKEAGPWWMFKRFRREVKKNAPKASHLDEGVECLWCTSLQFGIVIAISAHFCLGNPIYDVVILALAISAIAVIFNQTFTKGK